MSIRVPLYYVAYKFDFCLLPNSNLQLESFVPSLLGPLCNSWLCILCIFFQKFLRASRYSLLVEFRFSFFKYVFLSTNGWYLFTSLFWIETHIQQESVPRSFLKEKFTAHHQTTGNLEDFQKQTQGMHHPTRRFCRCLKNKASSTFFLLP